MNLTNYIYSCACHLPTAITLKAYAAMPELRAGGYFLLRGHLLYRR